MIDVFYCFVYLLIGLFVSKLIMLLSDNISKGNRPFSNFYYCDKCGKSISFLAKYFVFVKKCDCKKDIDKLFFSLLSMFSILLVYIVNRNSLKGLFILLITIMFLFIAYHDYKTHYVLNLSLFVLFFICLTYAIYKIVFLKEYYLDYLFSIIIIITFFLCVRIIGKLILKKESLGMGDVYLSGVVAVCIKASLMIFGVMIGSVLGSIIELIRIKRNKTNKDIEIAFCPYLCFGFYTILLFEDMIFRLILR